MFNVVVKKDDFYQQLQIDCNHRKQVITKLIKDGLIESGQNPEELKVYIDGKPVPRYVLNQPAPTPAAARAAKMNKYEWEMA